MAKTKNVSGIEAMIRFIMGLVLLIFSFFIEGISRWVVGLIGVLFVLTAMFGY
jgi:hypothetical protein